MWVPISLVHLYCKYSHFNQQIRQYFTVKILKRHGRWSSRILRAKFWVSLVTGPLANMPVTRLTRYRKHHVVGIRFPCSKDVPTTNIYCTWDFRTFITLTDHSRRHRPFATRVHTTNNRLCGATCAHYSHFMSTKLLATKLPHRTVRWQIRFPANHTAGSSQYREKLMRLKNFLYSPTAYT